MAKRRVRIEEEPVRLPGQLTVSDILSASAEYDHEHTVRSIGPAIVLVLERDAPMRLETISSTESEFQALLDEVANNERWGELLALFDQLHAEEETVPNADLWTRVDAYTERLMRGKRISSCRVADEVAS